MVHLEWFNSHGAYTATGQAWFKHYIHELARTTKPTTAVMRLESIASYSVFFEVVGWWLGE
jgi:hypothetical protein